MRLRGNPAAVGAGATLRGAQRPSAASVTTRKTVAATKKGAKHDYLVEKRDAFEKLAASSASCISREGANVVTLRR